MTNYPGPLAPELKANTLETYRIKPGQVILIGKDGGVKNRLDQVDLDALFADIDANAHASKRDAGVNQRAQRKHLALI